MAPLKRGQWVAVYTDAGNCVAFGIVEEVSGQDAWLEWGRKPRRVGVCNIADGQRLQCAYWQSEGYCEPLTADLIEQHGDRLWQLLADRDLPALRRAFPQAFEEIA